MSAIPGDFDGDWDDEWDPKQWSEFAILEDRERDGTDWLLWAGKLAAVALILPLTLGLLVAVLILIF